MSSLLVRLVARQPRSKLAQPSAAAALAVVLTYASGLALTALHVAEGAPTLGEPALVVQWLRDATLALPLAFVAVWAGVLFARRLLERHRGAISDRMAAALLAAVVADFASLAVALAYPAQAWLFGGAGHHHLPFLVHLARDAALALAVNLPAGAVVVAALRRRSPWAAPSVERWRPPRGLSRLVVDGAVIAIVGVPVAVVAAGAVGRATAAPTPGVPCPAVRASDGKPVVTKTFDVVAINVDIPLNHFGDHDPFGRMYALRSMVPAIREQERTQHVSPGLRDDPIQPLTLHANVGDCVEVHFTNELKGSERASMAFEGVSRAVESAGSAVGNNPDSTLAPGESTTYRFYIEDDTRPCQGHEQDDCSQNEGAHYFHSFGTDFRDQIFHGLFGSIVAEPRDSQTLDPRTGQETDHGWDVAVKVPDPGKDFRDFAIYYHEVGDETFRPFNKDGQELPLSDPFTDAYRPDGRAMNYRSESFFSRILAQKEAGKQAKAGSIFSSYANGDPSTPILANYLGDPIKMRIIHGGGEVIHSHHLHGGGDRWPFQTNTNPSQFGIGLQKTPILRQGRTSILLDVQLIGPGDTFTTSFECGGGGCQQSPGDFLFHCHVNEHYEAGMWSFLRTFNTLQPDLKELPDQEEQGRAHMQPAVNSVDLIGHTLRSPLTPVGDPTTGRTITADNVKDWVEQFLPPAGQRRDDFDSSVWDWTVVDTPRGPLFKGEANSSVSDPAFAAPNPGERPDIMFDPVSGRPAYPLLKTHIGQRPPFGPGKHGPTATILDSPDREFRDRLCPTSAPRRHIDVRVANISIPITRDGRRDDGGIIYVKADEEADMRAGRKKIEPIVYRVNTGDCARITYADALPFPEDDLGDNWANIHPHFGQFDMQSSDGVVVGFNFMQSVRPFKDFGANLTAPAHDGDTQITVDNGPYFHEGAYLALGLDEGPAFDVHKIKAINGNTITLEEPVKGDYAAGRRVSDEFVNTELYFDFQAGTTYFHDHVNAIGHLTRGMFGAYVVEPPGSTFRDPNDPSHEVGPDSGDTLTGSQADILTPADTLVYGTQVRPFREQVLIFGDNNPVSKAGTGVDSGGTWTDYRLEPLPDRRGSDPSLVFSSVAHGDPFTPLARAYVGDRTVFRVLSGSINHTNVFAMPGQQFPFERFDPNTVTTDSVHVAQAERFDFVFNAGGPAGSPGDYLWLNGLNRHFVHGNWGLLRVFDRLRPDLPPLPGNEPQAGPGGFPQLTSTGGAPPPVDDIGNPCQGALQTKRFDVSLIQTDIDFNPRTGPTISGGEVYVDDRDLPAIRAGRDPEPLVLHITQGTCLEVHFTNRLPSGGPPATFAATALRSEPGSSGITAGFNPQQAVDPGHSRMYRLYAPIPDRPNQPGVLNSPIADFGHVVQNGNIDVDSWDKGAYGLIDVAPAGYEFRDPATGKPLDHGTDVVAVNPNPTDTHPCGQEGQLPCAYRSYALLWHDSDKLIGMDEMPYNRFVEGTNGINYRVESLRERGGDFPLSSKVHGDPATPLVRAYAGDPVRFNVADVRGEQIHGFTLDGHHWPFNPVEPGSSLQSVRYFGPMEHFAAVPAGGAGGERHLPGDYLYGDHRMPFLQAGLWGIFRVLPSDQAVSGLLPLPKILAAARADAAAAAAAARRRDHSAPLISRLRLRPRTLTRRARSARLTFRLSERASVRLVVQRRCAKKRCARRHHSVVRTVRGRRGANRIRIPRALRRHRLARGRYVLLVRAIDPSGNRSRLRRLKLTVRR